MHRRRPVNTPFKPVRPKRGHLLPTPHSSLTTKKNEPSRFLSLPPELRNHIYEVALTAEVDFLNVVPISNRKSRAGIPSALSLLLTCRQIYNEAQGIFYFVNYLSVSSVLFQDKFFLGSLSLPRLKAIHSVTIGMKMPDEIPRICECLAGLRMLKNLEFVFKGQGSYLTSDREGPLYAEYVDSEDRFLDSIDEDMDLYREAIGTLVGVEHLAILCEFEIDPFSEDWAERELEGALPCKRKPARDNDGVNGESVGEEQAKGQIWCSDSDDLDDFKDEC